MPIKKKVLVAGSFGVSGRAATVLYASEPDTEVYGLSRRSGPEPEGVQHVSVDLLNRNDVRDKVAPISGVTHIVFGAYIERPTATEKSQVNVAILRNLLDVVEQSSPELKHITFYQGGKAYGADLGPFKTPAREDDPRLMPPNFYYAQEDLLRTRQKGKQWHFTALRPEAICGFAVGNPMNLAMVIAVYATLSKAIGIPLRFPGPEQAYRALYQVTYADILAKATLWSGESIAARNEVFNVTNGDYFRWQHMWPKIARMFEMEVTDQVPTPIITYMADKAPLWEKIRAEHGLQPIPYEQIASWQFGDFIFNSGFDNISSTIKARKAGFQDCIDTEDMFRELFDQLRRDKVIPKPN